MLSQFGQLPDFPLYALAVFAQTPNQPGEVRQRAGLVLKNSIAGMQRGAMQAAMVDHIGAQVLAAMQDPNKAIRHTGGTILTTLVQRLGLQSCSKTLEQLVKLLDSQSQDVVEGSLSAVGKICEDGVELLLRAQRQDPQACNDPVRAARAEDARLFLTWASQQVLPPMFARAAPASPAFVRQIALECLSHFALQRVFEDQAYGLQHLGMRYMELLGALATDTSPEVLQLVCKGFVSAVEEGWACLTPQFYEAILQFMLKASQHPEYDVRLEALGVWISCSGQPDSWGPLQAALPALVPVLVTNMVYAEADYMILEPSQVENDNANVPDPPDSIKPRFHAESKNIDGDEDDDGVVDKSTHGWTADEWTARKAAAKSLDCISGVMPELVVPLVLPQIEQKLNHASWEHQEAGVLALGAIGVHCQNRLQQFLPAVINLLLRLCDAPQPLLRSISSWCVGRFGLWIFSDTNASRQQVIPSVLKVILPRCLDRNKRVQEATISALMSLEETGKAQLVPYLNDIVGTIVNALSLYQVKNLRILYDTVNWLVWAVGPELDKPHYVQGLLDVVFQRYDLAPDTDVQALPLSECVASLCQVLGKGGVAQRIPKVIMRCVRSINDTAMAVKMWEQNPNEFERPDTDIMSSSCDVLSGILEGLQEASGQAAASLNFLTCIALCLRSPSARARQSGFWLMSVSATHCLQQLQPLLPELLPLSATNGLGPKATTTVSMNACWAIGEVYQRAPPEAVSAHLNPIVTALVAILQRRDVKNWQVQGHDQLLAAVCMLLNRLRQTTALGQQWPALCAQLSPELRATLAQRYGLSG